MKPFIDRSIGKIERPQTIIVGAPSEDTLNIDPYRQGVEVSRITYFLRSNLPLVSSKGIKTQSPNELINHELDYNNLGQGLNLDGFKPFEDQYEIKKAALILTNNIIQSNDDPFFGRSSQDGQIDIFSDTGKRSFLPDSKIIKSKGASGTATTYGGTYSLNDRTKSWFLDAADSSLGIPVPGYSGNDVSFSPFIDKINMNAFEMQLEYTYVGPDERSPTTGQDYYGSNSGTDSIAYGGFLR